MKIESKAFHRRDAEHAEMTHLFSLPLRRRQRKIIMPFGQGLISSDNLREALDLSLFCPLSRKGKNVFLCDLCVWRSARWDIDLFTLQQNPGPDLACKGWILWLLPP